MSHHRCTRRRFLGTTAAALAPAASAPAAAPDRPVAELRAKALVAVTLDLEMSRNFPTWETTHWDYEKGNLNDETKRYTVEACRRIRGRGGVAHCFAVGRVFEQEDVGWLRGIIEAGHAVGNHTYDHVNVLATRAEDIQFRFRRCPWLIEGQTPAQVIRHNIQLCTAALRNRVNLAPAGFRTPGGFRDGLREHPHVQQLLQDLGFTWVSSLYPAHALGPRATEDVLRSIVHAQRQAQPFAYPRGLIEIPMSPISDIGAFRGGRWRLDDFLRAIRMALEWCLDNRAVFDFLCHPSCLYVVDPQFRAVELICDMVRRAGNRALIVDLNAIARRVAR
ncbi:MAG: polysaccharide deacetylase family protein [Gemmataceae bacterium]|nr:polysaccharide deacetylase family protein [Gemmataceae bacterium]